MKKTLAESSLHCKEERSRLAGLLSRRNTASHRCLLARTQGAPLGPLPQLRGALRFLPRLLQKITAGSVKNLPCSVFPTPALPGSGSMVLELNYSISAGKTQRPYQFAKGIINLSSGFVNPKTPEAFLDYVYRMCGFMHFSLLKNRFKKSKTRLMSIFFHCFEMDYS